MAFVITARGDQLSSTTRDYSGQDFDEESTTISPNSGDNGLSNPVPNVTRQNRENSTNIVELPPKKEELPTQPPAIQIGSKPNITISHNAPIVVHTYAPGVNLVTPEFLNWLLMNGYVIQPDVCDC